MTKQLLNGFLQQTAIDYGLSVSIVEKCYSRYFELGTFYERLEEEM
jgi:hypothetical protein